MGAPGCFITTYRRNLQNELAADSEQYPPGIIGRGYELYDHLTAAAPRPVLILARENDYFDLRGAREAYRHLRRVYTLLGQPANIRLVVEQGGHGYGPAMGAAMAAFFCRQAGITPARNAPSGRVFEPAELNVTRSGQVALAGSRPIYEFTRQAYRAVRRRRPVFTPGRLKSCLGIAARPAGALPYRVLRPFYDSRRQRHVSRFAIETEAQVFAVLKCFSRELWFHVPAAEKITTIHLPHVSCLQAPEWRPPETDYFVLDVRGLGESLPRTGRLTEPFLARCNADFMYASYCDLLGDSLLGRRVYDVLAVLRFLRRHGHAAFALTGRGLGGLHALMAAVLDRHVRDVTLTDTLASYAAIIQADLHDWPLSGMARGILRYGDLPDMVRYLRQTGRRVKINAPAGASCPAE